MAGSGNGGEHEADHSGEPNPIGQALDVGVEQEALGARAGQIAQDLGGIVTRREELETAYETQLTRLKDQLNADQGKLGEEKITLEDEKEQITGRQTTLDTKVRSLGSRIRTLADREGAPRDDQLAYAAYATGDLTPTGLGTLSELDELIKEEASELFVVEQQEHLAFGKIQPDNEGLIITTRPEKQGEHVSSVPRVHLPVQAFLIAGRQDEMKLPQYGWVSSGFDGEYEDEHRWDGVEGRYPEDSELLEGNSGNPPLSNFNLSQTLLSLQHPTKLQIVREFPVVVTADEILKRDGEGKFLAGTAAQIYLHAFIGSRLEQVSQSLGEVAAAQAFSQAILVTQKMGIGIDLSKIANLEDSLISRDD
jgi:hypothetical protein